MFERIEHFCICKTRPLPYVTMDTMNLEQFTVVFTYLEPWCVRRLLSVSRSWNSELKAMLPMLDDHYFDTNRNRVTSHCHSDFYLKQPYDYSIVVPHQCDLYNCPSIRCHRTNYFGKVHWDITKLGYKPLKCTLCGEIFINHLTARRVFFLRETELKNTNRYWTSLQGRRYLYKKHEIQLLALKIHHTPEPFYRKSAARDRRELLLDRIFESIQMHTPFTKEAMLETTPFRMYREGSWKINAGVLYSRLKEYYPVYQRFHSEWESTNPIVVVFSDMTDLHLHSHGFINDLYRSLPWFLGESIFYNNVDYGLVQARSLILTTYRVKSTHVLYDLTASFEHDHPDMARIIDGFKDGNFTLQDVVDTFQRIKKRNQRKRVLNQMLHRIGIHCESFPYCNTSNMYTEEECVSTAMVVRCMRNHINGTKKCITY